MEIKAAKRQATFRLDNKLLDRLRTLAKEENKSLNSFVECILLDAVYYEPNEETIAAIEEARSGKNLETLDLSSFKAFVKSLE